ncbi:metallophosphoesterase [Enterococcus gilvus]|uniref:metallophosphoesterase n=1 Tax=Enterococcus gilvus TaxID=160453 RepID=UPI0028D8BF70|nr:metallophosphoesterase [Enterococcus gilvus]
MKFFIADTHFCHEKILRLADRPFENLTEMEDTIVKNWNDKVTNSDEIFIIGDFMYKGSAAEANRILKRLNGKKYLITGNHEKYLNDRAFDKRHFCWIKDYYSFKENKQKYVLFHYPILEWDGYFSGAIHLYGHVHGNRIDKFAEILGPNAINVGVDVNAFTPISQEEILQRVKFSQEETEG